MSRDRKEIQLRSVEALVDAYRRDDPVLSSLRNSDGRTNADLLREKLMKALNAGHELPRHWYTDRLGKILGLPVDE